MEERLKHHLKHSALKKSKIPDALLRCLSAFSNAFLGFSFVGRNDFKNAALKCTKAFTGPFLLSAKPWLSSAQLGFQCSTGGATQATLHIFYLSDRICFSVFVSKTWIFNLNCLVEMVNRQLLLLTPPLCGSLEEN